MSNQYYMDLADEHLLATLNEIDDTQAWNLVDIEPGVIELTDDFGLPVSEDEIRSLHAQVKAAAKRTTYTTIADEYLLPTLRDLDSTKDWELHKKGSDFVLQDNFGLAVSESDLADRYTLVKARTICRKAIDAARAATAAAGVTFLAPANSTLDGVAVSVGSTQTTYIDHPDPEEGREYWTRMVSAGSDVLPEFDCTNGRFATDAAGMAAIIAEIKPKLAAMRTAGRRLEDSFRLATTAAQYDAITDFF